MVRMKIKSNRILGVLLLLMIIGIPIKAFPYNSQSNYQNVLEYGASGKGINYDTKAVQDAIDSTFSKGGGTVYFPAGKYLIKTVVLKSNVRLLLDNGTIILGSTEMTEFKPEYGSFRDSGGKKFGAALIYAEDAENIAIEGNGTINGQGFKKYYPNTEEVARPSIIRFKNCKRVVVKGVTLINSAAWVQHYIQCEDLTISGVTVNSFSNKNNDGLDIESCKRVYITGCNINTEDDSIVLKTLGTEPCKDVVISDCIIGGLKSAIKTGTESIGNFENITITNCTIYGTRGINLIAVDGGSINNVTISNISMRDSYAVIILRLAERMRPYEVTEAERPKTAGTFKNIMINNVQAVNVTESNDFITGIPGHYIENVTLSNVRIEYAGGGKKNDSQREIDEMITEYPKAKMFGILPSYGLFVRHAKRIYLNNVSFSYMNKDERSVLIFDDVIDVTINGLTAESNETASPFIWLKNSKKIKIQNSSPIGKTEIFLKAENTKEITLLNNELSLSNKYLQTDTQTKKELIKINNY
jgi:polygalacturonase|tara:strand:+ start:10791 stop:12374 length:1584 start_codon:yes stop_codon:yes gene_type:complete